MKKNLAQTLFTEKVGEYIAMGCEVNTATMRGSQGETAKMDFRIDNHTIDRITLGDEYIHYNWGGENDEIVEHYYRIGMDRYITVKIERFEVRNPDMDETLCAGHGKELFCQRFVRVGRNSAGYITTIEDATACYEKKHERYQNRRPSYTNWVNVENEKAKEICARHARKIRGSMKATPDRIHNVQKRTDGNFWRYEYTKANGKTIIRAIGR